MLKFEKVTKLFENKKGKKLVLKDVSVTFPEDKNIAILGYPSSGKSTIIKLINGAVYPTSGKVISNEKISWPLGTKSFIKGELSGKQNSFVMARILGLNDAEAAEKLIFIKEFSELADEFDEPVKSYSNSNKSKLAMAIWLGFDFDTYLIDDSNTLKDLAFKGKFDEYFNQKLAGGSRLILSTHDAKAAKKLCNYFVVIKNYNLHCFENFEEASSFYNQEKTLAA